MNDQHTPSPPAPSTPESAPTQAAAPGGADPREVLHRVFGYRNFRPLQGEIVAWLLQGRDALVIMPTGGGKSLCYQIPALVRDGTTIVVSPLIALMQDQVDGLVQAGVRAAALNSSMPAEEQRRIETALCAGELDLLYMAPERLLTGRTLDLLERVPLSLIAIDEAHCVSQWGHDFRPEYLKLALLAERFPAVPRVALTATADRRTRDEIAMRLGLREPGWFLAGFDRPNIHYAVQEKNNPREQLLAFIRSRHAGDAGIVYCMSRRRVDDTAAALEAAGIPALPYHAGLSSETRERNQQRFLADEGLVMVATIAFGMGIDKPNVRFVAHLDLPRSLEAYYQETGRAGRDGLPADAWMVYGFQDVIMLRQMLQTSTAEENQKRIEASKLEAMLGFCEITACRRQHLLGYFGDTLAEPCGNCDTCLDPPKTWDATEAARKALSCAYRTGQRYGVNYLIDVLTGKTTERIREQRHERLSTFGIGRELDARGWRSVFRQLVARGLLTVDAEGHGSLRLTDQCRALLRGETRLELREDRRRGSGRRGRERGVVDARSQQLWDALRACRKQLADAQDVPPYLVFHDATLMEMLAARPRNEAELAAISGVGETKLAHYGAAFLAVLAAHGEERGAPSETIEETRQLFAVGMDAGAIARRRGLAEATVYQHLAALVRRGDVALAEATGLPAKELDAIRDVLLADSGEPKGRLKRAFEALEGQIGYGILRCVSADLERLSD